MPSFLTIASMGASSFVLALSGAMMPGPLLTATISESTRQGSLTGLGLMTGHALLELGMVAALLFGLAPFLNRSSVFAVIAISGAAILMWMAWGMLRALPELRIEWDTQAGSSGRLVTSGALLSLANPYWSIWWATIGLGYIMYCRTFGPAGVAAFYLGHIAGDIAWYSTVSVLVTKGRHILTDRLYRGLIGACAVFLAGFACYFVYAGITKIIFS